MANVKFQTRGVLGGAYQGKSLSKRTLLTHLVYMEPQWNPRLATPAFQDIDVRTGCRQPLDNMADACSDPEGNDKRPTCPVCAKKWDKLMAQKV